MPRSLADFLEELSQQGELVRIGATVDPVLEAAEIARRVARSGGPAVLFDRLAGHAIALVANLLGTEARICRALKLDSLEQFADRLSPLWGTGGSLGWLDRLRLASEPPAIERFRPKAVKQAPCQQVVHLGRDVDLNVLPALQSWPRESHRSLTAARLVSQDVAGHQRSVSLVSLQVLDHNRLAILDDGQGSLPPPLVAHADQFRKQATRMPLAVALGGDPAYTVAASLGLPVELDGYLLAGMLRDCPLELVKCRTQALEVPADVDLVIEGHLDPAAESVEVIAAGAASGHYRRPVAAPVFHVAAMTQRSNPVLPAIVPGLAGGEVAALARAKEWILLPLVKAAIPALTDYALPGWGGLQGWALLSIRKTYPHQARQAASAFWGLTPFAAMRFVVIVDEAVDVHDHPRVLAEIGANVHPGRDLFFQQGPAAPSDHAAPAPLAGHHVGIDATSKLAAEHPQGWPERLTVGEDLLKRVEDRWKEFGLGMNDGR